MQIFSKLQRNSFNYLFVKLIFLFFVVVLNSEFLFFPLALSVVIYCESLLIGAFYLGLFSIMHGIWDIKALYLFSLFLFYKLFVYQRIDNLLNKTYKPVVSSIIIYILLFPLFGFNNFYLIYVFYNIAFDIAIIRIFKCEPTL